MPTLFDTSRRIDVLIFYIQDYGTDKRHKEIYPISQRKEEFIYFVEVEFKTFFRCLFFESLR